MVFLGFDICLLYYCFCNVLVLVWLCGYRYCVFVWLIMVIVICVACLIDGLVCVIYLSVSLVFVC